MRFRCRQQSQALSGVDPQAFHLRIEDIAWQNRYPQVPKVIVTLNSYSTNVAADM
jgi:hypothetical protein